MGHSEEHLVAQHLDALYGLAKAWAGDEDLAQDLAHRTFLKAFERMGQLRDPGALRSWLVAILRNEYRDECRRRSREVLWEEEAFEALPGESGSEDPLPEGAALQEALPGAFDSLPGAHRDILLLRFQQELSYEDMARTLEVPVGTVMSRLYRAKAALKARVEALVGGDSHGR